jgi:hypothetical protein
MKTSYLILAALGTGVILLLTSDKGKDLSKSMINNAGELKGRLGKLFKNMNGEMLALGKNLNKQMCDLTGAVKKKVAS